MANEENRRIISQNAFTQTFGTGQHCPVCHEEVLILKMLVNGAEYIKPCACKRAQQEVEQKVQEAKEREEAHRKHVDRLFENSHMPKRERGCRFDNFIERPGALPLLVAAKRYCENFDKLSTDGLGLLISGPCGAGKTHIAAAIVNQLTELENYVRFCNVSSLLHELQASFGGQHNDWCDIIDKCEQADLLVLDDLGANRSTAWAQETLYQIINSRVDEMQPTVITTNLTLKELESALDSRIVSRLLDKRCFTKITVAAEDFRRTAAPK